MIIIRKLIKLKGAEKFGTCNSCGKTSSVGTMFCSQCKYVKECETIADEILELNDRVDLCAMVMKTKAIEIVKKGSVTDD